MSGRVFEAEAADAFRIAPGSRTPKGDAIIDLRNLRGEVAVGDVVRIADRRLVVLASEIRNRHCLTGRPLAQRAGYIGVALDEDPKRLGRPTPAAAAPEGDVP